jgi:hypothetical protein
MAAGSGAFSVKAGYNQSGGAYLYILNNDMLVAPDRYLNVFTPGTGSGGATTVGSFGAVNAAAVAAGVLGGSGTSAGTISSLFGQGRLVRDMGKTVVSAGRTFKKIQAVLGTDNNSSPTFGVTGAAATATNPGYATFFVETGYAGANADGSTTNGLAPPPLVRML